MNDGNGNMGRKKPSLYPGLCSKLTRNQEEVLNLLVDEKLTPKQIASRRKTTVRAVNLILQTLKQKGAFTTGHKKASQILGHYGRKEGFDFKNGIRLHAEQWLIKLIWTPDNFKDKVGIKQTKDNNEVRIHQDSIEIYSSHSFFGSDTWAATAKSSDYWNHFFAKLEQELRVVFLKPGSTNIKRVKAEYAHIRNGLAIQAEKEGERIRIRARDDGKIWFEIDNSFNLNEAETKHPQTAHRDMRDVVEPFFNKLRDNPNILTDTLIAINQTATHEKEIAAGLQAVTHTIQALANSQQTIFTVLQSMLPKPEDKDKEAEVIPKEKPTYFG